MTIALVGLPGVGKSRIGRELAARLGYEFVDTDHLLAAEHGMPAGEFFRAVGEAAYREHETRMLQRALDGDRRVVSTGGGTIVRAENRRLLTGARVIGLNARDEHLLPRLRGGTGRPVLQPDPASSLAMLRTVRLPLYREVAEAWFWTETTPARTVDRIITFLELTTLARGVYFGRGARHHAGAFAGTGQVALLMQPSVAEPWGGQMRRSLAAGGRTVQVHVLPDGEEAKTLGVYGAGLDLLARDGLERSDPVVALGGGALCDVAGFLAATYLRGVPLVSVPTSLLGMVDAAIGGKTGINLEAGKNLAGSFYPARATLLDPELLRTLPGPLFRDGLAEVVKVAVGLDRELFRAVESWPRLPAGPALDFAIARAAGAKLRLTIEDPQEHGDRVLLNLGHTLGHAVEAASGFSVSHGQAVSIGLAAVCRYAALRHGFSAAQRVVGALRKLGLPTEYSGDRAALRHYIAHDKKRVAGQVRLVIPAEIGRSHAVAVGDSDVELLIQCGTEAHG